MAARQEEPAAPKLVAVTTGTLVEPDTGGVLDGDEDLDGVRIAGLRTEQLTWTGRRRLGASRMESVVARTWSARGASVVGCVLEGLDVVGLEAAGSSWWNVEITGSRIGSAELYDSSWRAVHFVRCKLGFLNLRGAKLTDVAFTDCTIDEVELGRANATRVAFLGSRVDRIELTGSTLADVDLRGARLTDVGNPEGLRGASISLAQLLDLAPALAGRLGIRVE